MKGIDLIFQNTDTILSPNDSLIDSIEYTSLNSFFSDVIIKTQPITDSQTLFYSDIPDWLTLVFLSAVVYLIAIKFLLNINFLELLKSILKIEAVDDVSFDKNSRYLTFFIAVFAFIVIPFYLYFIINPAYLNLQLDYLYLVFGVFLLLAFIIKKAIEYFISLVFQTKTAFVAYSLDQLIVIGISSLIQLIFIIFFVYSSQSIFLYLSLFIFALFFGFRLLRSFIIGFKLTGFSKSYLFLYLCSLEILPIIWMYKWLSDL